MAITTTFMKGYERKKFKDNVAHQKIREVKNQSTLKELQAKEYPFPKSDVPVILDELLTKKVIALPESKVTQRIRYLEPRTPPSRPERMSHVYGRPIGESS